MTKSPKPTHYETPEEREARYVTEEGQSYFTDANGKPLVAPKQEGLPRTLDNGPERVTGPKGKTPLP